MHTRRAPEVLSVCPSEWFREQFINLVLSICDGSKHKQAYGMLLGKLEEPKLRLS